MDNFSNINEKNEIYELNYNEEGLIKSSSHPIQIIEELSSPTGEGYVSLIKLNEKKYNFG